MDWPPKFDPEAGDGSLWYADNGYEVVASTEPYDVGFHRNQIRSLYPTHWYTIKEVMFEDWYKRPPLVGSDY